MRNPFKRRVIESDPPAQLANVDRIPVEASIGRRLPGKAWVIGYIHRRGRGWRVRERQADNSWEDVAMDGSGMVEVVKMSEYEYDVFYIQGNEHIRVATTMNERYGPEGWEAYAVIPQRHGIVVHMRMKRESR